MTAPRYQDVPSTEIPEVIDDDGTRVKVIVGEFWGRRGPVDGIAADPQYLDIFVPAGVRKTFKVETERDAFAYIFEGSGSFRDASKPFGVRVEKEVNGEELHLRDLSGNRTLVQFDRGDEVTVQAGETGGFLDLVLTQIADFQARDKELRSKVLSAAIYPLVLAALAIAWIVRYKSHLIEILTRTRTYWHTWFDHNHICTFFNV